MQLEVGSRDLVLEDPTMVKPEHPVRIWTMCTATIPCVMSIKWHMQVVMGIGTRSALHFHPAILPLSIKPVDFRAADRNSGSK
jgi:hypothetical protein